MEFAIIIEKGDGGFGAYVPDLPGCVAAGESEQEVRDLIREAIVFHLVGLREDGEAVPEPSSRVEYVFIQTAA
ncbi:MAG TPA: type II toxin-antitoxin system HicB family antitoxin [Longimicrobiaceae bacterium]|nr:type II toxin-antitoxin system HicB family antitoxin [Longimicrobiaceae bacterium]